MKAGVNGGAAPAPSRERTGDRATKPTKELAAELATMVRKPMAVAARVTLFEREVKERLSTSAIDILLGRAQVLSEGRRSQSPSSGSAFFGSTMLTIDLGACADVVRETCDPALARRLASHMNSDARLLSKARTLAEREAERLAGVRIRPRSEVRVRAEGLFLYIDIDVEGPRISP